jgi:hypothetical protein
MKDLLPIARLLCGFGRGVLSPGILVPNRNPENSGTTDTRVQEQFPVSIYQTVYALYSRGTTASGTI